MDSENQTPANENVNTNIEAAAAPPPPGPTAKPVKPKTQKPKKATP